MKRVNGRDTVLITGGAGFIGCNVANDFAREGWRVRLLDNLSRPGVERNLQWLQRCHGKRIELVRTDVGLGKRLDQALIGVEAVYHFAAQVAVTSSLDHPGRDFRTNLVGTFNLLEAMRRLRRPPPLIFASTNKVYGNLESLVLREDEKRYVSVDTDGIDESQPLEFHSPYGCSKGAADQYVLDYARVFDMPATVLRLSCMYGPRQFGTEDQGWVAHFLRRAMCGETINLYGNGKQVRDILYVDDLVRAQRAALEHIDVLSGRPWNLGGGPARAVSLLDALDMIARVTDEEPQPRFHPARTADQLFYASNHDAFTGVTGWKPRIQPEEGVRLLHAWLLDELDEAAGGSTAPAAGQQ